MSYISQPASAGQPFDVILVIPRPCPPEDGCRDCAKHGACPAQVPVHELTTAEIAAVLSLKSTCPVESAILTRARTAVLAFLDAELAINVTSAASAERSAA